MQSTLSATVIGHFINGRGAETLTRVAVLLRADRMAHVRVDQQMDGLILVVARARVVHVGELVEGELAIGLDRTVRILKIVGFSERRGNASAARELYDDLQDRRE